LATLARSIPSDEHYCLPAIQGSPCPFFATDGGEKNGPAAATTGSLARAVTLHLAGKREEALKQLERAVDSGEASPELYRAMGHIQFELEAFADAADSYRSLTELKPQYAKGWFNLVSAWSGWRTGTKLRRRSTKPPRWTRRTWKRISAWA
jgi:tetratricopeptide (TPR) repeat protein